MPLVKIVTFRRVSFEPRSSVKLARVNSLRVEAVLDSFMKQIEIRLVWVVYRFVANV